APGPDATLLFFASPAPNPARSEGATFRFGLPVQASASLTLFDQQGRRVRELAHGMRGPGEQRVRWDGRDASGRPVASGIYFARLEAMGRTMRVRFAVLR